MSDDLTDARLEREIKMAQAQLEYGATLEDRRAGWLKLKDLAGRRTEAQIERMESERGLQ